MTDPLKEPKKAIYRNYGYVEGHQNINAISSPPPADILAKLLKDDAAELKDVIRSEFNNARPEKLKELIETLRAIRSIPEDNIKNFEKNIRDSSAFLEKQAEISKKIRDNSNYSFTDFLEKNATDLLKEYNESQITGKKHKPLNINDTGLSLLQEEADKQFKIEKHLDRIKRIKEIDNDPESDMSLDRARLERDITNINRGMKALARNEDISVFQLPNELGAFAERLGQSEKALGKLDKNYSSLHDETKRLEDDLAKTQKAIKDLPVEQNIAFKELKKIAEDRYRALKKEHADFEKTSKEGVLALIPKNEPSLDDLTRGVKDVGLVTREVASKLVEDHITKRIGDEQRGDYTNDKMQFLIQTIERQLKPSDSFRNGAKHEKNSTIAIDSLPDANPSITIKTNPDKTVTAQLFAKDATSPLTLATSKLNTRKTLANVSNENINEPENIYDSGQPSDAFVVGTQQQTNLEIYRNGPPLDLGGLVLDSGKLNINGGGDIAISEKTRGSIEVKMNDHNAPVRIRTSVKDGLRMAHSTPKCNK